MSAECGVDEKRMSGRAAESTPPTDSEWTRCLRAGIVVFLGCYSCVKAGIGEESGARASAVVVALGERSAVGWFVGLGSRQVFIKEI